MNSLWYQSLLKPKFTPPAKIFPIAWGILYFLILCSIILYIAAPKPNKTWGYICFGIQMLLNFAWSPIFFRYRNVKLSFVIICFMLLFIVLTIIFFCKTTKIGAILLIPYLLWVSFAAYLNYQIWKLNS